MNELEKLSQEKISSAKERSIEFLKGKIKDSNPQLYDQLLVSHEKRKLYFFTDYTAESLTRTVRKYEFPLLSSVESTFRNNFIKNESNIQKIDDNSIFRLIENLGVQSESDSAKNVEKLVYYNEIPIELEGESVKSEQPYYYIPTDTVTKTCHTCSGEKYTTCEEHECHGQHIYTCSDCSGDGEVTCSNCDGKHEYECSRCKGKGELTCFAPECKNGKKRCNSCDGDGYKTTKYSSGKVERAVCTNRCGNGWLDCSWCKGTGMQQCSSSRRGWIVGAVNKAIDKEHCEGVGRITCNKCKPNGKIDCESCHTSGEITCEVCYGDHTDNRYGKIDCKTCKTAGELGVLTYIENKINYHSNTDHTCSTSKIETEKFSISNIKKFVGEIKQVKVYSNINKEELHYDAFSEDLSNVIEKKLGLFKDQYPKILNEHMFYECVPCSTVTYKHILSGTEHQVSLVGIHTDNPELIYHSDPTKVEAVKGIEKNVFKDLVGKAFSTKKYKQKIEMRNEIILMVHVAKADGEIEDSEKEILAKYITGLDDFTNKEKQELFDLMSSAELPKLTVEKATFYSEESSEKAIDKLIELATKADGKFEDEEKKAIEEIKVLIQQASKSNKGGFSNFFSTWQISLPLIMLLLSVVLGGVWFMFLQPATSINTGQKIKTNEKVDTVSKEKEVEVINTEDKQLDEVVSPEDSNVVPYEQELEEIQEETAIEYYKINDPDGYSNLRDAPKGEIIQKVYDNEKFEVIGQDGDYKEVKLFDGTTGFIHKSRVIKK